MVVLVQFRQACFASSQRVCSVCVYVGRHDRRLMSSTKGVCSRAVCICGLGGGVDVVEEGCRPIKPKQGASEGESERETSAKVHSRQQMTGCSSVTNVVVVVHDTQQMDGGGGASMKRRE